LENVLIATEGCSGKTVGFSQLRVSRLSDIY